MSEIELLQLKLRECEKELQKSKDYIFNNEKTFSLGFLVAGFAHDLSTPIGLGVTATSNFLELTNKIKNSYDNEEMTQEEFEEYLLKSQKTANLLFSNLEYASKLMLSFKKVSLYQTGESKLNFNLHDYFDDVVSTLHNKLKTRKISIINEINKEIKLNSYPGVYSQIFTNLILNSLIHAFEEESTGEIKVTGSIKENRLILEYFDNGKGVCKENLAKIFDPFFTTKGNEGGSGLGANIIYTLVTNRLQGKIDVISKENEGIHFTIVLPLDVS